MGTQESSRRSLVIELHQPGTVGPGAFFVGGSSGLVGIGQEFSIVAFVFQDPAGHAHGKGGITARLDRHPALGLGGHLGEARVEHRDLELAGGDLRQRPRVAVGGAVVAVDQVGTHEDDILGIGRVGLPVEFQAILEGIPCILFTHPLAGKVEGALADSGVAVAVDRTEGLIKPFREI